MQYAIIGEDRRLVAIVDLPVGTKATWVGPPGFELLFSDRFDIDQTVNFHDYLWNGSSFDYIEPEPEPTLDDIVAMKVAEALAAAKEQEETC